MTERRDPLAVYRERLAQRRDAVNALDTRSRRLSDARLAVFAAGAAFAWFAWGAHAISGWWVLGAVAAFVALIVLHDRTLRRLADARRAQRYYEEALARVEERWNGSGETRASYADASHPYADDLDLFGERSLFAVLSSARTRFGESTLAAWLLRAATPEIVRERQLAVEELRDRIDFREELAVAGAAIASAVHPDEVVQWAAAPPVRFTRWQRLAARTVGILAVPSIILAAAAGIARAVMFSEPAAGMEMLENWPVLRFGYVPLIVVGVLAAVIAFPLRDRVHRALGGVEKASDDLALLIHVLAVLDAEEASAPALAHLRRVLTGERPASASIARLRRLVDLLDSARNQFFAPIAPLLLWRTNIAMSVEQWRSAEGSFLPDWLAAIGEWEALASLSAFAFEHPAYPFPEIVAGGPLFEAKAAGHPLIPSARRITNDVTLGDGARMLLISGSNMSGKSTMLRTVGVNAVLALAGAPVCARSLRISPLAIGASIRINDSLAAGESRFYAEIKRLRQIVDIARSGSPLLFLLDEILHGTNSHDRRIGAEGVIHTLVASGAVGLVTTHDLALATIVEHLGVPAANVHFEDHLEDGRMAFDYTMRPGVVAKSNALELMRAVGLEVG